MVDPSRVYSELHKGAIYHMMTETYLVEKLDPQNKQAIVIPCTVKYYTEPRKHIELSLQRKRTTKVLNDTQVFFGEVTVSEQVIGYLKKEEGTESVISGHTLNLPPVSFETSAVWFEIPNHIVELIKKEKLDFLGGLHAIEHATIAMTPLHAVCDRWDIGGISFEKHPDTNVPSVFIYDAIPGGIGLAEKCCELIEPLLTAALKLIEGCECSFGCPSCIYSPKCGNNNDPLDKQASILILREILNQ